MSSRVEMAVIKIGIKKPEEKSSNSILEEALLADVVIKYPECTWVPFDDPVDCLKTISRQLKSKSI